MKKVITYGTFDLFHKGHYNILKRAKEHGDYLIVGVTGDRYDISRGKLSVHDDLATRIENVKKTGLADAVIVEEYLGQKISDVIKYDIDTLVIGDDWRGKFEHLRRYCDVVYLERTKNISSTQIRQEKFNNYSIGIITDKVDDNQLVYEASLISGLSVENVYSENANVLRDFQDKYRVKNAFGDLEKFVSVSDIIFVHCKTEERYEYIKYCLNMKKHVICDPPFVLTKKEQEELFALAKENKVALVDNVKMVYISVFNQLMWICQGGLIGEIVRFECSVSKQNKQIREFFDSLMAMALCSMIKIMGVSYQNVISRLIKQEEGVEFGVVTFEYPSGEAMIKVGNNIRVKNQMEIIGTKGTIRLKDNWWKSNYFELEEIGSSETKIYNMDFEGNGFKFLLREMLTMFENGKTESKGLFPDESIKIIEIMEQIYTEEV